jgi:hypothetical protein
MYDSKGRYIEPDYSLLHATREGAYGITGGMVGFGPLPWTKETVTYPNGRVTDACSGSSFYGMIAGRDPFHYYSMPSVPVYDAKYSVTKLGLTTRRRIVK